MKYWPLRWLDESADAWRMGVETFFQDGFVYFRNFQHFIFQNFQLMPALTALENVTFPLELTNRSNPKQQALTWLDKVGLSQRLHHYPHQLSGGEMQRVAIARAFALEPKILLADEPTGNLDWRSADILMKLLFDLNAQQGTTLIIVTHDRELSKRCSRQYELAHGQLK